MAHEVERGLELAGIGFHLPDLSRCLRGGPELGRRPSDYHDVQLRYPLVLHLADRSQQDTVAFLGTKPADQQHHSVVECDLQSAAKRSGFVWCNRRLLGYAVEGETYLRLGQALCSDRA